MREKCNNQEGEMDTNDFKIELELSKDSLATSSFEDFMDTEK